MTMETRKLCSLSNHYLLGYSNTRAKVLDEIFLVGNSLPQVYGVPNVRRISESVFFSLRSIPTSHYSRRIAYTTRLAAAW